MFFVDVYVVVGEHLRARTGIDVFSQDSFPTFFSQMAAGQEMWQAIVNGEPVNMVDFLGLHCDDDLVVEDGISSFAELERAHLERVEAREDDKDCQTGVAAQDEDDAMMEAELDTAQGESGGMMGAARDKSGDKDATDGKEIQETKAEKKKRKRKERKTRLQKTRAEEKRQVATGELSLEEFNRRELERYLKGTAMLEKGKLKQKSKAKIEAKMEKKQNKLKHMILSKLNV